MKIRKGMRKALIFLQIVLIVAFFDSTMIAIGRIIPIMMVGGDMTPCQS